MNKEREVQKLAERITAFTILGHVSSKTLAVDLYECGYRLVPTELKVIEEIVDDGFGTSASAVCPTCGLKAVYVCRPGDIRCGVCYDNNPKEWYTGELCGECGYHAIHGNKCLCCGMDNSPLKTA